VVRLLGLIKKRTKIGGWGKNGRSGSESMTGGDQHFCSILFGENGETLLLINKNEALGKKKIQRAWGGVFMKKKALRTFLLGRGADNLHYRGAEKRRMDTEGTKRRTACRENVVC